MKTLTNIRVFISLFAINAGVLWGAPAATNPAGNGGQIATQDTPYAVVDQGANHRVWQRTTYETLPSGQKVPHVQQYTELATGLNYQKNGKWVESKEEIELYPGGAIARQGRHQVIFANNLATVGAIDMQTPDGKRLRSHVLGLSYFDTASGQSVMIAEVKDSQGELYPPNVVIYPDAFTDFKADVRYTYTRAGFEQDIILRERPPRPEAYGLNPATTKLQVLTEFINPPQPVKRQMSLKTRQGDAVDEDLDFGAMQMGRGKAFSLDRSGEDIPVSKQWLKLEGRDFLVEEVAVPDIDEELQALPAAEGAALNPAAGSVRHVVSKQRRLPTAPLVRAGTNAMQLARLSFSARGLVLDYVTMTTQTGYTFQGDTTYYISGAVNLYGTNTFEGGAVLKYASNASLALMPSASPLMINWLASAYRPVVLTAKDDNSVGATISGSTGNPSGYYANPALRIIGTTTPPTISYFRIAYAQQAFSLTGSAPTFSNGQIVNCQNGITVSGANTMYLRNILFGNVQTNFNNLLEGNFDVQNSTFSGSAYLSTIQNQPYQYSSVTMANCLLVNVTNLQNTYSYPTTMGGYQVSGGYNGFYNSPTFGAGIFNSAIYPFQSVGAGNYYLTNGCNFFGQGTTNIDATLLAALKTKTTHPPSTNPPYQYVSSGKIIWSPVVSRDTSSTPDLGYHYDPLDYLCSQVTPQCSVLLTNGVAVGFYGSIGINGGAPLSSGGLANALNHLVWYPSVQEQSINLNNISTVGSALFSTMTPQTTMRFTDIAMMGARQTFVYMAYSYQGPMLTLRDCQLHGVSLTVGGRPLQTSLPGASVTLQNCLLERCSVSFYNGYTAYQGCQNCGTTIFQDPLMVTLYNNLFWQCSVGLTYLAAQAQYSMAWGFTDNLFDNSAFSFSGDGNYMNSIFVSNNGYRQTTDALPGLNDLTLTALAYATSWFGPWHIGSSSPTLLYAGSRSAANAGLYHYTIQTNQVPDGRNPVSISYHYVATDAYGNPLDSNGDGIPDYLEDANGNGLVDSGETAWMLPPAITVQPTNQTVILNSDATFGVTATSLVPMSYQWLLNGTNLVGATNAILVLYHVQSGDAGSYAAVVANPAGSVTSSNAILTVLVPPVITQQPTNQTVFQGSNVVFNVAAAPTNNLNYQWYFNDKILVGATNYWLTITNGTPNNSGIQFTNGVQVTNAGFYYVVVANAAGSSTSIVASLTVTIIDTNFFNQSGLRINHDTVYTNATLRLTPAAQNQAGSAFLTTPIALASNASFSTFFSFRLDHSNTAANGSTNGAADGHSGADGIVFVMQTLTNNVGGQGGAIGYGGITNSVGVEFDTWYNSNDPTIDPQLPPGQTNINGTTGDGNHIGIDFNGFLTNSAGILRTNAPSVACQHIANDMNNSNVWYAWVDYNGAISNMEVRLSETNSARPLNPTLAYTNINLLNFLGNKGKTNTYVGFTAATGGAFNEQDILSWQFIPQYQPIGTNAATPPVITQQPSNVTTNVGGSATFSVTVSTNSTLPLSYQWWFNTTNLLAGPTNTSLTLSNVQTTNAGNYLVVVTNVAGSVTSSNAVLTVIVPPVIMVQPTNQTVFQDSNVTFSVTATGTPPLSYQWYFNSGVLPNATNAMLTLTGVTTNQAGTYLVTVTNVAGSAVSSNAVLTVYSLLPIVQITSPINQTLLARSNVIISATATNVAPGVTISSVQFFVRTNGGTSFNLGFGVLTNGYYQVNWPIAFGGTFILSAEAMDSRGSNAWSAPVTNLVRNLPAVSITSPTNGQLFLTSPVSIPILAAAIPDPSTIITNVTFYQGTNHQPANIIGVSTSGGATGYGITWSGVTNGTYLLSAEAFDTNGGVRFSPNIAITVETNQPPSVYAGPNQTINLWVTNTAQLVGVALDDGLPLGSTLSVRWSLLGNSTNVTFINSNHPTASASFLSAGIYTLQMFANDSQFTSVSTVIITVVSNQAPVVYAGPDQTVVGQAAVQLQGVAADDGQPYGTLLTDWSVVSGPGTVTFADANLTNTIAIFGEAGSYQLLLSASDEQLTSSSSVNIMVVASNAIPYGASNYLYVFDDQYGYTNDLYTNFYATNYDDSSWTNGQGGFGNYDEGDCDVNNSNYINTYWSGNNYDDPEPGDNPVPFILLRRHFYAPPGTTNLTMGFTVDNNCEIFINGILITDANVENVIHNDVSGGFGRFEYPWFRHECCPSLDDLVLDGIFTNIWHEGDNLLAVCAQDEGGACFFDSRISINSPLGAPDNQPPVVAVNQSVFWTTNTVQLQGWVLDDGLPRNGQAVATWTNVSGPGIVTFNPYPPSAPFTNYAEVDASASFSAPGTYVLQFLANDSELSASNNVTVIVNNGSVPPPSVSLVTPANNAVYATGAAIPILASAGASAGTVTNVQFYASASFGNMLIGSVKNSPYSISWTAPVPGTYSISAAATDSGGRVGYSSHVNIQVLTNSQPVAGNDWFIVFANSHNNYLNVLANDYGPNGNSLKIISVTRPGNGGTAIIANGGTGIWYTPPYGTHSLETTDSNNIKQAGDGFDYVISDGKGGTAQATVYVGIFATSVPVITITNLPPPYPYTTNAGATMPLIASITTPWQYITKVDFYIGETLIGEVTNGVNGSYTLLWTASADACDCPITASASDVFGQWGVSPAISINVIPPQNNPGGLPIGPNAVLDSYVGASGTQQLTNLVAIRDGIFNLYGRAYHPLGSNDVVWRLGVYSADGTTLIRDLTPNPVDDNHYHPGAVGSSTVSGLLVSNCDLTTLQNGIYYLRLDVIGGLMITNTDVQFILDSNLKLGQFSFSQQDLVIPVNGIPLTVTRTYNSINPNRGDFGYGWTFAINSMDVSIDETRQDVEDGDWNLFSQRSGGGYDVSLTLPNGQRTTFYFTPRNGGGGVAYAEWRIPPGVTDVQSFEMQGDNRLVGTLTIGNKLGQVYWQAAGPGVPVQNFDIPGYILTMKDGTVYQINRDQEEHYMDDGLGLDDEQTCGPPYLAEIDQRSGDKLQINPSSIVHKNPQGQTTSKITIQRVNGLITSISDLLSQLSTNNPQPSIKYEYDGYQNLMNVERLVDRTAGTYVTNSFAYTNANFPHYITGIINADGTQVAKNFYDDTGKLIAVQDANGKLTRFIHNPNNNMEVVIDRLGRTNTYVYDLRGNVIFETNALGQATVNTYDTANNLLSTTDPLNRATSYAYDGNGNRTQVVDALNHTNFFSYDSAGDLTGQTDPLGNTTTNIYDSSGNLTGTIQYDQQHNFVAQSSSVYQGGQLVQTVNASGQTTATFGYDPSSGYLINTTDANGFTRNFAYDANGNQTNSSYVWVDPGGTPHTVTTSTFYDAQGRVTMTIDADGNTNQTFYTVNGKVAYTIDKFGNTNSFLYDARGNLIQTIYPNGTFTSTVYDDNSQPVLTTDPNQITGTLNQYDAVGRATNVIRLANVTINIVSDPLNPGQLTSVIGSPGTGLSTNSTTYFANGWVQSRTGPDGRTTTYDYWPDGQTRTVTDPLLHVTSYAYDSAGHQTNVVDALTHSVGFQYDAVGRLIKTIYADNTSVSNIFNNVGQRIGQVDQAGLQTQFGYNVSGQLTNVTDALNQPTRYQYDAMGNEATQIDALNRTNTFACDTVGRKIKHTMPGGQFESFGYDRQGRLINQTNFNGAVITNQYDTLNRLTNCVSVNGFKVSYTYTLTGQRATMTDGSGVTTYGYDALDRLVLKTVAWNNGPVISLNYRYDVNGNVINIWSSSPGGVTNVYQYDALNRLTNVVGQVSSLAQYSYDAVGNLQTMRYDNGVTNLCQYDSLNRLTNSVWKLNAGTLASFYYQLGLNGTRTNLTETVNTFTRGYAWNYDARYRLTNETVSTTAPTGTLGYSYDAAGNRTNRSGALGILGSQAFTYNTNDWLKTDACDNNGNTLWSTNGTVQGPYFYDVENRLTNYGNNVYLTYNGDGSRVKKTVDGTTTFYLVDDRNPSGYAQVLEEWTASGGMTNLSKVYNYGLSLISQRAISPQPSTNYFIYDGHGSTRMLTDSGGNFVNAFAYDAYGNLIASNGVPQTEYLYCCQQWDTDLGSYYLRARTYNPGTGRFPTADSYGGNIQDPLSLHKYLYCQNNPVNGIDPSGHEELVDLMCTMAIQSGLSSMVMPVVSHAFGTLAKDLIPRQIFNSIESGQMPDGGVVGIWVSGSAGKGGASLSLGGAFEGVISDHNFHAAAYFTPNVSGSLFSDAGAGGSATVYLGAVWNCSDSESYKRGAFSVSVNGSILPQKFLNAVANQLTENAMRMASAPKVLPGGFPLSQDDIAKLESVKSTDIVNRVNDWNVTVFWAPGEDVWGVTVGRDFLLKKGKDIGGPVTVGYSYAFQIVPDDDVRFK